MREQSVRTCLGCRGQAARHELLRVVAVDSGSGPRAVPDPQRRLPGRGANLHPTPTCLAQALRRRAFPRALRVTGTLSTDAVEEYVDRLAAEGETRDHPGDIS